MAELQQNNTAIKPEQIIEIIINRKWLIVIPLCISLTLGLFYTFTTDKIYLAKTTILIQPQKVPTQYIQSVVSSDLNQRLNTISQQILSQSNLEKIIDQFGLYQNNKEMYLEDKIKDMRRRIIVNIEKGTRRTDTEAFSVSFTGSKPDRVMRIANTLASYFMDENLKVRENQAIGTSEFLQSELLKIQSKLEERERILSQFRTKYMGGLPDEIESNLRTLDRLQLQLSDKQSALRDLNNSINLMQSQINRDKEISNQNRASSVTVDSSGQLQPSKIESEQLLEIETQRLDELLLKYTSKHPEVIKSVKKIDNLKEKVQQELSEHKAENDALKTSSNKENKVQKSNKFISKNDQYIFKQEMQLKQLNNDVQRTQADIVKIQNAMKVYQQRVEDTPKREQELRSLQRDYANIQDIYNSLLDRQLESELAVNMEKKQKGEQFRILDHARLPEKPFSPDVRKLFLLSIAVGLGLGGGVIFLLEFLDTSIKRPEQIEADFGLPVLSSIPSLKKPGKNYKKKIEWFLFAAFTVYAIGIFSAFAIANSKGLDKTINFIKFQLNM